MSEPTEDYVRESMRHLARKAKGRENAFDHVVVVAPSKRQIKPDTGGVNAALIGVRGYIRHTWREYVAVAFQDEAAAVYFRLSYSGEYHVVMRSLRALRVDDARRRITGIRWNLAEAKRDVNRYEKELAKMKEHLGSLTPKRRKKAAISTAPVHI